MTSSKKHHGGTTAKPAKCSKTTTASRASPLAPVMVSRSDDEEEEGEGEDEEEGEISMIPSPPVAARTGHRKTFTKRGAHPASPTSSEELTPQEECNAAIKAAAGDGAGGSRSQPEQVPE